MANRNCYKTAFCFSLILLTLLAASFSHAQHIYAWDEPASLTGHIEKQRVFGPPGFGETPSVDREEVVVFLALDRPISLRGVSYGGESTAKDISRVQLLLGEKLEPGCVRASCLLFEGISAHHRTRVVMDVMAIETC